MPEPSWSPTERAIPSRLDAAVSSPIAAAALLPIGERVLATLARGPNEIEAWESAPLELYGTTLPSEIRSSWIFVLRRGVTTGAERHPNSIQRMTSLSGGGDFQVHDGARWTSRRLTSDPRASLEDRWISIPPDTWHQGIVGSKDWLSPPSHPRLQRVDRGAADPDDPDPISRRPAAAGTPEVAQPYDRTGIPTFPSRGNSQEQKLHTPHKRGAVLFHEEDRCTRGSQHGARVWNGPFGVSQQRSIR
jgi:hypothetical protein